MARVELLEPRWVLSSPSLAAISDISAFEGAPYPLALQGYDADGDTLSYTITSSNADALEVIQTSSSNHTLQVVIEGHGEDGGDGVMTFQLFDDYAPNTVARILELVNEGYFNNQTIDRVIANSYLRGGDEDGTGETFDDEYSTDLQFTREGILAMFNAGNDTNDAQFLITDAATRWMDYEYTIFGFLTSGEEVRESLMSVTNENGVPTSAPVIKSVTVIEDNQNDVVLLKVLDGSADPFDVTVTVTDSSGNTALQSFTITPYEDTGTYSNSHPYLNTPIDTIEMAANSTTTVQLTASDVEGDGARFLAEIKPSSPSITASADTATGLVTITATNGVAGAYAIYFQVYDNMAADTESEPLWIYPAAPAKVTLLNPSSSSSTTTNRDNSSDKTLQFEVDGVLSGTTVTIYADGVAIGSATAEGTSVTVTTTGTYQLSNGTHSITAVQTLEDQTPPAEAGNYTGGARDLASAASAALTITVDLDDASDTAPPTFLTTPVKGVGFGATYTYDANTDDDDTGVTYRLVTGPDGMAIDDETGVVTWTAPTYEQLLEETDYSVTIAAEDLSGNEAQQSYTVHVGTAPTFDSYTTTYEVSEGDPVTFTLTATDDNAMPLTFEIVGGPAGATVTKEMATDDATSNSCVFSWTPSESQGPETYTITIRATDSTNVPADATITVTVAELNLPPTLDSILDQVVDEGKLLSVQLVGHDDDLPANTLTYSFTSAVPEGMTIDSSTGLITWTPDESAGGHTYTITVQVSDGTDKSGTQSFEVEVGEGNNPPLFNTTGQFQVERGSRLVADVSATDPDDPDTGTLRYQFTSDTVVPDGMSIDLNTGELTWNVPSNYAVGTVSVTVRVVEIYADKSEGLDQTLPVKISVVAKTDTDLPDGTDTDPDPGNSGGNGNGGNGGNNGGDSPTNPIAYWAIAARSQVVMDLLSPGRAAAIDVLLNERSALGWRSNELGDEAHVLGDNGLFGFRLAPDTGRGGRAGEGEEEEDESEPRLEDAKSKLGTPQGPQALPHDTEPRVEPQGRPRRVSRYDSSDAYDAAVQALVDEIEQAVAAGVA
jgi:cyclophilin family peptidyl-prolyl cis-trans isomerase